MKLDRYKTRAILLCIVFLLPGCPRPGIPDITDPSDPEVTTDTGDGGSVDDGLDGGESNNSPRLSAWAVSGILVAGRESTFIVQCQAVDEDGDAVMVVADLSELGGASNQEMNNFSEDTYMWNGTLTPPSGGDKTITIRATDSRGATDEASFSQMVEAD
jgi:hypothetical protein